MKKLMALGLAGILIAPVGFVGTAAAESGGCLKYGAAGAVGGHMAGHGVAGAVAGCATGMAVRHRARQRNRQEMYQQDSTTLQRETSPGTTGMAPSTTNR